MLQVVDTIERWARVPRALKKIQYLYVFRQRNDKPSVKIHNHFRLDLELGGNFLVLFHTPNVAAIGGGFDVGSVEHFLLHSLVGEELVHADSVTRSAEVVVQHAVLLFNSVPSVRLDQTRSDQFTCFTFAEDERKKKKKKADEGNERKKVNLQVYAAREKVPYHKSRVIQTKIANSFRAKLQVQVSWGIFNRMGSNLIFLDTR